MLFHHQGDLLRNGVIVYVYFHRQLFRPVESIFDDRVKRIESRIRKMKAPQKINGRIGIGNLPEEMLFSRIITLHRTPCQEQQGTQGGHK